MTRAWVVIENASHRQAQIIADTRGGIVDGIDDPSAELILEL